MLGHTLRIGDRVGNKIKVPSVCSFSQLFNLMELHHPYL